MTDGFPMSENVTFSKSIDGRRPRADGSGALAKQALQND
jgi:hypothetical protein